MPFWKKNEDPWDNPPERRETPAWFSEEPAAQPPAPAAEESPERCPWCGGDMKKGYLTTGRACVFWTEKKPLPVLGFPLSSWITVTDEGFAPPYKTCWYCPACRKLAVDVPEPSDPNCVGENGGVNQPDGPNSEESEA